MLAMLVILLSFGASMTIVSLGALSELQSVFGFSFLIPIFKTTLHQAAFFVGLSMVVASLIPVAMAHGKLDEE